MSISLGMNTEKLRSTVRNLYGFSEVHVGERFAGGYWNEIYPLKTDRGTFVIRWYHQGTALEGVPWEHGLMAFMDRFLPQVPIPVPQRDGSTYSIINERVAAVLPLMSGSVPDDRQTIRAGAAHLLARLHRVALNYPALHLRPGMPALRALDWYQNWIWDWDGVQDYLDQISSKKLEGVRTSGPDVVESVREVIARSTQIADERDSLRSQIAALAKSGRELVFGPIQGDYYSGNLLVEDDRITAVLDWDESRSDWQCYELARATWEFCHHKAKHTLDEPRDLSFIQCYQDAGDWNIISFITRGPSIDGPANVFVRVKEIPWGQFIPWYNEGAHGIIVKSRSYSAQSLDPKIKHHSRLNMVLAHQESRDVDPDGLPIMLDMDGNISEGVGFNVMVVKDGVIKTSTDKAILQGVSRHVTIGLAKNLGIPLVEEDIQPYDVYTADEVFFTRTTPCIVPCSRVDNRSISDEFPGPITQQTLAAYSERVGLDIVDQALRYGS